MFVLTTNLIASTVLAARVLGFAIVLENMYIFKTVVPALILAF